MVISQKLLQDIYIYIYQKIFYLRFSLLLILILMRLFLLNLLSIYSVFFLLHVSSSVS